MTFSYNLQPAIYRAVRTRYQMANTTGSGSKRSSAPGATSFTAGMSSRIGNRSLPRPFSKRSISQIASSQSCAASSMSALPQERMRARRSMSPNGSSTASQVLLPITECLPENANDSVMWLVIAAWDINWQMTFGEEKGFLRTGSDVEDVIHTVELTLKYFSCVGIHPPSLSPSLPPLNINQHASTIGTISR